MPHTSLPLTRREDFQREACPLHFGFYHCGDFAACCAVDPCGFLRFMNPCDAAIAALEDQDSNNGDGGNGNDNGDGNGDGGDEDITTTARHTSTLASPSSLTKNIKTTSTADDSETTSSAETRHTSSSASLSLTSSVEAPTTIVNSTTFGSGISISTSPTTGSSVTETLPPAPSEESNNNGNLPPSSKTTIAGVSVGGVVGGIALLLLLFWLLRRRRLSKRMSSLRGDSPGPDRPPDEKKKSIMDRRHSLTGTALGAHSFPEIGGQAPDPNHYSSYTYTEQQPLPTGIRQDEGWPLYTAASDPSLHQQQYSSQQQKQQQRPVCAELDSAEKTQLAGTIPPGPRSSPPNNRRRPSRQIHPSRLTPGFPGTQMPIQSRSGSGSCWDTDVGVDRGYYGYASSVVNANAPGEEEGPPRATLNATDDERLNNLYANSWARGL
ncbi:hypothetical protein F4782DRAFT_429108 [Xylaria castorea]|nr:hypothetical protein F4782DRAFT_429108 [Xylaria castorea]